MVEMKPLVQDSRLPARIVFAAGGLARLDEECEGLGLNSVLLIAGTAGSRLEAVIANLGGRLVAHHSRVIQHVPESLVHDVIDLARERAVDGVVTVGGGSATGLGKAVARETGLPLVAVPTTYAGSEMTPIYGTTTEEGKVTGRDWRVLPSTVIYDPDLTLTMSPELTASSGLNAIAHCLQGLWGTRTTPFTQAYAERGLATLYAALPRAVRHPHDASARGDALVGASLAGAALAGAGTGLHHAICHQLGGRFALRHSALHSAVLPQVIAYNTAAAPAALATIQRCLGEGHPQGAVADAVFTFAAALGAPTRLRDLGLPRAELANVAYAIVAAAPDNPADLTVDGVRGLLEAAWAGAYPATQRPTAQRGNPLEQA
ncbi:maleylacetate reductase [Micromonospora rhizosphaerae]|uniref:Maleylacetate reductase n=1 Tax=Micromonospora rhizosphaerae TaxID=568872 RepID=A0A1C6SC01_9ACTN|nr:iron-containing alcohol dehydrogenase [Micromonospora rhizosphaerae]SCL27001.1 maleylacetate reductase [Micromonospora rhizosphaerae]